MNPMKYSFTPIIGNEGFMWVLLLNGPQAANDPEFKV
jgi:hypothetical protein